MPRISRSFLSVLLATAMLLIGAGSSQAAQITGVSDENAQAWPGWAYSALGNTGVTQVRHIVPWNVATDPAGLAALHSWVNGAEAHGFQVTISFNFVAGSSSPPGITAYTEAMQKFRTEFPQIGAYTAWNEPNHHPTSSPKSNPADNPGLAALYWVNLNSICNTPKYGPTCTVAAGDFLDGNDAAGLGAYIDSYKSTIAEYTARPSVWAIHPYTAMATNDFSVVGNGFMPRTENKPIWFTEAGGMVCKPGVGLIGGSYANAEASQNTEAARLLNLMNQLGSRLQRTYYYFFAPSAAGQVACPTSEGEYKWDSALMTPDGFPRPAFKTLFPAAVLPPVVGTGTSGSIGLDVATVGGSVDPRGYQASSWFEYGTTTSYGKSSAPEYAGFGSGAIGRWATFSGLQPATTYHYRIAAWNPMGTSYGEDRTFTTAGLAVNPVSSSAVRQDSWNQQWFFYADKNGELSVMYGTPAAPEQGKFGTFVRSGTVPTALRLPNGEMSLYYISPSGEIRQWIWNGTKWIHAELKRSVRAGSNLSVIRSSDGTQNVYYVATNGQIKQMYFAPGATEWKDGYAGGYVQANASPTAVIDNATGRQWIYYLNSSGQMSVDWWENSHWYSSPLPVPVSAPRAGGTPTVLRLPNGEQSLFYVNTNNTISQYIWNNVNWNSYNVPKSGVVRAGTNPTVVYDQPTGAQSIYYVNSSASVAQLLWAPSLKEWINTVLGGTVAAGSSPAAFRDASTGRQWVFTREAQSTLVWEWTTASWVWSQKKD